MPIKTHPLGVVTLFVITTIAGCVTIPTQEMSDARQAIQAARQAQAEYYAPNSLAIAQQNLAQAEQHLEEKAFEQARLVAILAKRQAFNSYNMTKSLVRAQKIWQTVSKLGDSAIIGKRLLEKAYLSANQNKIDKTIKLANQAYYEGETALNQAQLKIANQFIKQLKQQKNQLSQQERVILHSAEQACLSKEGNQAYQFIKQLKNQLP